MHDLVIRNGLVVDGTGAEPVDFTSDARKALAFAIDDAEGNNPAVLKLLRQLEVIKRA